MFSMSRSTKNFPQLKMCDNCMKSYSCWNAFFCWLTAFGYSNNQREATLLQNVKYQRLNFENHWHIYFFTAILITYIKGGTPAPIFFWRRGLQRRGLHLLFFYWSYQVLLTDVVIIPRWAIQALVEYLICIEIISYAKMSDWLLFNSKWEIVQLYLGLREITPSQFDNYEY